MSVRKNVRIPVVGWLVQGIESRENEGPMVCLEWEDVLAYLAEPDTDMHVASHMGCRVEPCCVYRRVDAAEPEEVDA